MSCSGWQRGQKVSTALGSGPKVSMGVQACLDELGNMLWALLLADARTHKPQYSTHPLIRHATTCVRHVNPASQHLTPWLQSTL